MGIDRVRHNCTKAIVAWQFFRVIVAQLRCIVRSNARYDAVTRFHCHATESKHSFILFSIYLLLLRLLVEFGQHPFRYFTQTKGQE